MIAKRSARLAVAVLCAGLVLGGVAVVGSTQAQAAVLGTMTLDPASATTEGNLKYPTFTTSAPCPGTANAYEVWVSGPGAFARVDPIKVITNVSTSFSSTAPFTTDNASSAILDLQKDLEGVTTVNLAGEYTFTLRCIDDFSPDAELGTFVGKAYYTTPTAYQATPPKPTVVSPAVASGTFKVGSTVSCAATFSGGTSTPAYSWYSDGAAIGGATTSRLTLTSAHANRAIGCGVSASNANGATLSKSATRVVALGSPAALRSAPKITGTVKVKKSVTCTSGTWSLPGVTYGYKWKANGKPIAKATKAKYKIATKYKGKKLSCTVSVKKPGYATAVATSKAKKVAK